MQQHRSGPVFLLGMSSGLRAQRGVTSSMSYSDSPHCSDDLHPVAGPTNLQTANILQNSKMSELVCCTHVLPEKISEYMTISVDD